jgi:hypothetical protein
MQKQWKEAAPAGVNHGLPESCEETGLSGRREPVDKRPPEGTRLGRGLLTKGESVRRARPRLLGSTQVDWILIVRQDYC